MKRFLKLAIWGVIILVTLLLVAIVIIVLTFDPNKYKAEIAAAVHNSTGRDLTIQGDLKLSLFPWLGVETGAMNLSNAPGFGSEPFARISGAAIKVQLLSLLKRDVEVDTVTLDGLYLQLMRNAEGKNNWDDFTAQAPKDAETTDRSDTAAPALLAFAIGGVRVQDATVVWDDQQAQRHYELNNFNLHTGPIVPHAPITLALNTELKSATPDLAAQLSVDTEAAFDLATQQLQLKALRLSTSARGKGLPVADIKLDLDADALLKLDEEQYQFNNLQLQTTLQGDALPGKKIDANLNGAAVIDLQQQTINLTRLNLAAWNLKLTGDIAGQDILTTPRFRGHFAIAEFNARELIGRIASTPLNTADPKALGSVNASLDVKASATDAEISNLLIKLDQTQINGKASIKGFDQPAYRLQLSIDDLDADRYLPPPSPAGAKPVTPAAAVSAGAGEVPLEALRNLNAEGELKIAKLKIAKLKVSDIKFDLNAKQGLIRAYPLAARLYKGEYSGDLQLDARGKAIKLSSNESLQGVAIGPLTQDLLEKDVIAGTGNVTIKLTGTGLDPEQLKRTLNGSFGFALDNGRINGVNLIEMIQKDYLKYIQGLSVDPNQLNQTVFSRFSATAAVTNGMIETKDLLLNSAQLNVKGRGTANLANEQLALRLDATSAGQLAKQLGQFKDTVIPIRIEGTFTAPKFATDLDEMFKQKAKARLEKEKQKLQEELKQKTRDEKAKLEKQLQDKFKDLLQ